MSFFGCNTLIIHFTVIPILSDYVHFSVKLIYLFICTSIVHIMSIVNSLNSNRIPTLRAGFIYNIFFFNFNCVINYLTVNHTVHISIQTYLFIYLFTKFIICFPVTFSLAGKCQRALLIDYSIFADSFAKYEKVRLIENEF